MISSLPDRWEYVSSMLQSLVDRRYFPNVVTQVNHHGEVVYQNCTGWMDIDARKPVTSDTIFRIYSMSKPITCAAMLMLFEEGKFFLDDPVAAYIPAFKDMKVYAGQDENGVKLVDPVRPITIRQLFTHTSGLGYGILMGPVEDMFRQAGIFDPRTLTAVLPLDQAMDKITHLPLAYQPGTVWSYSIAHFVIGYLISLLSGMPFDQFLHQRMFEPLEMVDTGFWVPPEKQDRLTAIYTYTEPGQLSLVETVPDSPYARSPVAPAGGEGLVSTQSDYMRFARMLLSGGVLDGVRVLSRKTVELMTSNHLAPALLPFGVFPELPMSGSGYGLGVSVMMDRITAGHLTSNGTFGWGGAAGTYVFIDPQEDLIGLLMTQTQGLTSNPLPPHSDLFQRLVYAAIE
jgi:CubicO group peptidase (beta-lactamase class C family)